MKKEHVTKIHSDNESNISETDNDIINTNACSEEGKSNEENKNDNNEHSKKEKGVKKRIITTVEQATKTIDQLTIVPDDLRSIMP